MTSEPADAYDVGRVRIQPVHDGHMGLAPAFVYPQVNDDIWHEHDALDGNELLFTPHGGFLLRESNDGRIVLVDTGFGPEFDVPDEAGLLYSTGNLIDTLAELGVAPAAVTDVVITHAHPDHVGWASVNGTPTFANADLWCHESDWQIFVHDSGPDFVSDRLAPLAPRLKAWREGAIVTDWLQLREAPGHTPGTALAFVESLGSSAALVGDLAHHPLEIANPDWAFIGDTDSVAASKQRTRWFTEFAANSIPMFAAHFPDAAPIRIQHSNGSLRVTS